MGWVFWGCCELSLELDSWLCKYAKVSDLSLEGGMWYDRFRDGVEIGYVYGFKLEAQRSACIFVMGKLFFDGRRISAWHSSCKPMFVEREARDL